jgi:hypothetical protein
MTNRYSVANIVAKGRQIDLKSYIFKYYLEDLGLFKQLSPKDRLEVEHDIVISYTNCNILNAIQIRLNMLWNWGSHCAISPTHNRTIYVTVRGGHGLEGSLRGNKIPPFIIKEINALRTCGAKMLLIPLIWFWTDSNSIQSAHSTLLVVYPVDQTYQLFDPNEGDMDVFDNTLPENALYLNRYDIISNSTTGKALIHGYKPGPLAVQPIPSLQTFIERTDGEPRKHVVPTGLCAVLTTLILVFCRRFQYADPWDVATVIRNHLMRIPNKTQLEMFRVNLANWFRHLYLAKSWAELERGVGLLNPPERVNRKCFVIPNYGTPTPCANHPCPGHAYCNDHRYMLLMERWHDFEHGNCNDPIDWKYNGALPLGNPRPQMKDIIWV